MAALVSFLIAVKLKFTTPLPRYRRSTIELYTSAGNSGALSRGLASKRGGGGRTRVSSERYARVFRGLHNPRIEKGRARRRRALIKFRVESLYGMASLAAPRVLFLPFPFSRDRRAPPARAPISLAVRGIVTKGFAVIPDLICMLMVMDVYLRSYSPVLSPPAIRSACLRGSASLGRGCRCRLMLYQSAPHLSLRAPRRLTC